MRDYTTTNQNAFTLLELLVTVAVVGILASVAVANYSNYRERAYYAVAVNQARDLTTALNAALIDRNYTYINVALSANGTLNAGIASVVKPPSTTFPVGLAQAAPGFVHAPDVYVTGYIQSGSVAGSQVFAAHCRGPKQVTGYEQLLHIEITPMGSNTFYSGPSSMLGCSSGY